MICYLQTTVALSLTGRTAWLVRDRSRADLNMIASLENYWAKITLRRVSTVSHNATDNKRNWREMQNHHWQDFGDCTDSAGLLSKEKDKLHKGTHLVTSPRLLGHRECKSSDVFWVVARRWSSSSAAELGAGVISPGSSGQTAALAHQGGVGVIAGVLGQRRFCPASCSFSLGGVGRGTKPYNKLPPRSLNCVPHTSTHKHTSCCWLFLLA